MKSKVSHRGLCIRLCIRLFQRPNGCVFKETHEYTVSHPSPADRAKDHKAIPSCDKICGRVHLMSAAEANMAKAALSESSKWLMHEQLLWKCYVAVKGCITRHGVYKVDAQPSQTYIPAEAPAGTGP